MKTPKKYSKNSQSYRTKMVVSQKVNLTHDFCIIANMEILGKICIKSNARGFKDRCKLCDCKEASSAFSAVGVLLGQYRKVTLPGAPEVRFNMWADLHTC